jgi:hypothetical protein
MSERAYKAPVAFSQELDAHTELPPDHRLEFAKILEQVSRHAEIQPFLPI